MSFDVMVLIMLLSGLDTDEDRAYVIELFQNYKGLFYKVAIRYFDQNIHDVEDAVSDAVVAMCIYLSNIRKVNTEKLPAYMLSIIRYACISKKAKMKKERQRTINVDISDFQEIIDDGQCLEEIVFARLDATELLESFSKSLNEQEKELIRMRHIDKLTIKEIASMLGKTEGAVRTALTRAKHHLEVEAAKRGGRK